MSEIIFIQLALILFTAFIVSYLVRLFKQPIVIGYIIAGMIISPFIIQAGISNDIIGVFSEFGIAFLLFIVGLHMNPKVIKEIGGASLLVGIIQISLTFAATFLVSYALLGFNLVASLYVGIALTFSSTIIVMKLVSDKRQLDSLYGKIAVGILIIQDLFAVAVLMFISSLSNGASFSSFAVQGMLIGGGLVVSLFLLGYFVLPTVMKNIAKTQELLFLFSICWCFIIAALFSYFGFSIEIGALVAGVVLSISPYSIEISSKIRPLRDFFLIIFFIILGLNIQITNLESILFSAIVLSLIALLFKPFILMAGMAFFGYTKRTNFFVGATLAQISEFSLIVLALGVSLGHITQDVLSTLTLTAIITITLSTYMIMYTHQIYKKAAPLVSFFERRKIRKQRKIKKNYDAVLFGYNRIGFSILRSLKNIKKDYLVVDFNPDTIANLTKLRIPCLYGDIFDYDLLEELPLEKIKLAVSTVPDFETNLLLIETMRLRNPKAIVIVPAHSIKHARQFYRKGANYVLTPHFLGGEYVSKMIRNLKLNPEGYKLEKTKHLEMLKERLKEGHEHPKHD